MLAFIPYVQVPILEFGPIVLDPWALLVCIGFIVGLEVARARGIRLGLDVRDLVDGALVTVGVGFVVGHWVHVLAYNPHLLQENGPLELLRLWGGFSSTGGFVGAILGSLLFYKVLRKRDYWLHADSIMFGFPIGWVFGRLGCFTAHDHIGGRTDFFLGVNFPGGARHDLGLYEALWSMGITAVFFALRKRPYRPGQFLALFAVLYAPARFLFDFLRNTDLERADVRWAGLTPAQYGMILLFVGGLVVLQRLRRQPPMALPEPAAPAA